MRAVSYLRNYFREVSIELRKVTWPGRPQTIRYTLIVIGASLAIALFLGGWDALFRQALELFIAGRSQ